MSDRPTRDTEPCPTNDDEDTDPGGHAIPDALPELERELIGLDDRGLVLWLCRRVHSLGQSVELALGQVQTHGERVGLVERRIAGLPSALPCQVDGCPLRGEAAE